MDLSAQPITTWILFVFIDGNLATAWACQPFVFQQSASSILMTRCDLLACGTYIPGWLLCLFVPRDLGPLSPRRSASQPVAAADLSS